MTLQLRYSGLDLTKLRVEVAKACDGMARVLNNEMEVLIANNLEANKIRAQRKWYQFWNHWWDLDVAAFLPFADDMTTRFRSSLATELEQLLDNLDRLRPTEIVLDERMCRLIVSYSKR